MITWALPVEFAREDNLLWYYRMEYGQSTEQPRLFGPFDSLEEAAQHFAFTAQDD